jgi:hypothetical protein
MDRIRHPRQPRGPGSLVALGFALPAAAALAFALPSGDAAAAPKASPARAAERLAGRALAATPLMEDLRQLCDEIGGRLSGSPAAERAVEWGLRKFREAGLQNVSGEPFTMPNLWLPESTEAACLAPEPFPIRAVAAPDSPSTPEGKPLEGRLVVAGTGRPEDFEALGETAKGSIALVLTGEMETLHDLIAEYMRDRAMLEAAGKAGVSAILLQSTRPRGLLYRHPVPLVDNFAPMPVALISREHASRLDRAAKRSEVRVSLTLRARTGGPYELRNVVGEIPGSEKPEEVVLLGAHLDSWDLGTGAEDNGVNVALAIDVARGINELGLRPRRTIRFVLFNGEEQGMVGSAGYVETHAAEMDDHVAAIIHDLGWGRVTGYFINGRKELLDPVEKALGAVDGLGPFHHPLEAVDGTDNFDFLLTGVPNLVADQDAAPYLPDYHAESDVLERVDEREARANVAIASALVWELANSRRRPASRQSRAEVEKLIEEQGLEEIMKAFGQWESWVGGRGGTRE